MKISQREKVMLIALCVILVGALAFNFAIKPLLEERTELKSDVKDARAEWNTITDPILIRFLNERDAELVWQQSSGPALDNKLNHLIYDRTYLLGNQITDLMGKAAELGDTSLLPRMTRYALTEMMLDEFIFDYIDVVMVNPSPITDIEYDANGETYHISQSRMQFSFTCVGNDINSFLMMLNKMEKSGYIVVESWSINPNDCTGDISFLVLMTPGDLSEYSVIQCPNPDCLRYNEGNSSTCKYCNHDLEQEFD